MQDLFPLAVIKGYSASEDEVTRKIVQAYSGLINGLTVSMKDVSYINVLDSYIRRYAAYWYPGDATSLTTTKSDLHSRLMRFETECGDHSQKDLARILKIWELAAKHYGKRGFELPIF